MEERRFSIVSDQVGVHHVINEEPMAMHSLSIGHLHHFLINYSLI